MPETAATAMISRANHRSIGEYIREFAIVAATTGAGIFRLVSISDSQREQGF